MAIRMGSVTLGEISVISTDPAEVNMKSRTTYRFSAGATSKTWGIHLRCHIRSGFSKVSTLCLSAQSFLELLVIVGRCNLSQADWIEQVRGKRFRSLESFPTYVYLPVAAFPACTTGVTGEKVITDYLSKDLSIIWKKEKRCDSTIDAMEKA